MLLSDAFLWRYKQSLFVHSFPFKKYWQYFVVPKLALIKWLSIKILSKTKIAIDASYGYKYVTYAE